MGPGTRGLPIEEYHRQGRTTGDVLQNVNPGRNPDGQGNKLLWKTDEGILPSDGDKTSAYHPETDGMVERFNGTLKAGIKKYIQQYQAEWTTALPFILFAYRETPHSTTGFSPFELVFGRTPTGPLDLLKREWTQPPQDTPTDVVSFLSETYSRMEYHCHSPGTKSQGGTLRPQDHPQRICS